MRRNAFGKTWWAQKWIGALEELGRTYSNRLPRGRTYARRGAVKDLVITPGKVFARVQGTRRTPYKVEIRLKALTDKKWQKVIKTLAKQAIFAAKLLTGEMPPDIDEVFKSCGFSLFPVKATELKTSCSCPDWANPCKHIAATHYILAEAFDRDPFLLFELRGWKKERVLEELRLSRSLSSSTEKKLETDTKKHNLEKETIDKLDEEEFVTLKNSLEDIHFHIVDQEGKFAILKRLGPFPGETSSSTFTSALEKIYKNASELALKIALGSDLHS